MKTTLLLPLFGSLLLLLSLPATAQEKYSKVKIFGDPARAQSLRDFVYGTLEVDHCHFEEDAYVVEISETAVKKLRNSGFRYEVMINDVAENFRLTNDVSRFYEADRQAAAGRIGFAESCKTASSLIPTPAAFTPGGMGGYYTYAEIVTKIGELFDAYPGMVDTFSLGKSHEGRDIWCVKISDNVLVDEAEPEVMFNALQHCREAISGTSLVFFMQYLCENYAGNPKIQQLVNNREFFLIPCVNPDGYVYNQTTNPSGGGMWRKNRRNNGGGIYGVDLNRNYNADWGDCNPPVAGTVSSCGSTNPSSDSYFGPTVFSEPETRAIRDFTQSRNFRMSIDQHSEGMYNTLPHGRYSLHPTHNFTDSMFLYGFASSVMATFNCHRLGNNLQTLNYEVAGGNKDWMFQGDTSMTGPNKRKVYSFTSEAGGGSFWPSAAQIIPLAKGLTFQYLQAALAAGSYADLQDGSDIQLSSLTGTLNYTVRRVGAIDNPITVSIIPLQNMASVGSPVVIPAGTLPSYYNTTSGNISYTLPAALGNGQRVRFIWRVSTDGISVDDTVTKFYNPVNVLYDDMETGAVTDNWTVSSGWDYTAAGQGLNGAGRALTESPGGNYTSGSTRTITYSSTINLSDATAAYLSFWVRHRSENCLDFLRVRISTNGGVSYTPVCGKHTIQENDGGLGGQPALTGIREEWTRELFDLNSYIGAGMNNIRLQFQFVSNTDPGFATDPYYKKLDDGFYLDNVRLIKSTSTLVTLPVEFISFDGRLLNSGGVELTWNASVDGLHDYFEVERSYDQLNFTTLGRVATAPPCVFVDPAAKPGNNYYRIKQVDKDGSISYSRVINIIYNKGRVNYLLYPNPVTDVMKIRFKNDTPETYTITVTDLAGRQVVIKTAAINSLNSEVSIDLKEKAAQVYMMIIRNSRNEIVASEKIMKQ